MIYLHQRGILGIDHVDDEACPYRQVFSPNADYLVLMDSCSYDYESHCHRPRSLLSIGTDKQAPELYPSAEYLEDPKHLDRITLVHPFLQSRYPYILS